MRLRSKKFRTSPRTGNLSEMFIRADAMWDRGQLRNAFRLFLAAARAGDKASQLNVGYFYDKGIGVSRNDSTALYWYRRAYKRGDASAANNIAIIWRVRGNAKRSLFWFDRAVSLGNDDSNIEIAKHYLDEKNAPARAISFLKSVIKSHRVAESTLGEAKRLLTLAKSKLRT